MKYIDLGAMRQAELNSAMAEAVALKQALFRIQEWNMVGNAFSERLKAMKVVQATRKLKNLQDRYGFSDKEVEKHYAQTFPVQEEQ